ncbi:unnamed protein product [Owenia fusiformis]|uniref:Uncharacterized protein n=1 Tax=Owenia fusiformis TaxID=6347 RepID=A0A8J1TS75_OWEFU|nr:unnamed protein product [Owenia fusiformis]
MGLVKTFRDALVMLMLLSQCVSPQSPQNLTTEATGTADPAMNFTMETLPTSDATVESLSGVSCNTTICDCSPTAVICTDGIISQVPSFKDPRDIELLNLTGNIISHLDETSLKSFIKVKKIDLSSNRIESIHRDAFSQLSLLEELYLDNNPLLSISGGLFEDLTALKKIVVDHNAFCCEFTNKEVQCMATKEPSEVPDCSDLVRRFNDPSSRVLEIVCWILGLVGVLGNVYVISMRIVRKELSIPPVILVFHMALANLLISIYTLIIAAVDLYYRDMFPYVSPAWRSSILCISIGVISTVGIIMSLFSIIVITLERMVVTVIPAHIDKWSPKAMHVTMGIAWIFSLAFGIIPALPIAYFDGLYGDNKMCVALPLVSQGLGPLHSPAFEYTLGVFMTLLGSSTIIAFVCYTAVLIKACKIKYSEVNRHVRSEYVLSLQMLVIVLTDCLVSLAIFICVIFQLAGLKFHEDIIVWLAALVLPLNAALNPVLYACFSLGHNRQDVTPRSSLRRSQGLRRSKCRSLPALDVNVGAADINEVKIEKDGMSLENFLNSGNTLDTSKINSLRTQIQNCLTSCHENKVLHSEVTAGNIVVHCIEGTNQAHRFTMKETESSVKEYKDDDKATDETDLNNLVADLLERFKDVPVKDIEVNNGKAEGCIDDKNGEIKQDPESINDEVNITRSPSISSQKE